MPDALARFYNVGRGVHARPTGPSNATEELPAPDNLKRWDSVRESAAEFRLQYAPGLNVEP